MQLTTESLARAASRRPWRTLAVWIVALIAAAVLSSALLGDALTTGDEFLNNPESKQADALVEAHRGSADSATEFIVVTGPTDVSDPAYEAFVAELQRSVGALGRGVVHHVGSYLTGDGAVSASGHATLLPVTMAGEDHTALTHSAEELVAAVATVTVPEGYEAVVAGPLSLENDFIRLAEEGLQQGETIGIAVALVVLVLVFGAVVAGLVPIVLAIMAIAISLGGAALIGSGFELSFFIVNLITMIGLAVGIDYSLFIVSRYREERSHGLDKREAIARAGATAGKAVFFSGMTVVLALAGMLLLPNTVGRGIGLGAILVVSVAVAASLTLLPAVLHLLGDRIDALHIGRRRSRRSRGRAWDRVSTTVMRRPAVSVALAGGVLLLAAVPFLGLEQGFSGVSTLPDEVGSKQAFLVLEDEFSGGMGSPVEIVVSGRITPEVEASVATLQVSLAGDPAFGPSTVELSPDGELAIVSVTLAGDVARTDAMDTVRRLRTDVIPAAFEGQRVDVLVGGDTAYNVDYLDQTQRFTPIVLLFVLGSSFLLLTVAFRSLVIPAKAIAMNLLSVAAAYGMLVLFFQQGTGPEIFKDIAGWLGFGQVEAIEAGLPLFLFSILFGLSMDYHVFMLSRIRERFDQTGDNAESVAYGLRTTGKLITGAAAIMVAVFAGFAGGPLVGLQQMGFGLAVAVALDATIVRTALVPATMKLLGARNWYLPRWLHWLPEIHIEGPPAVVPVPEPELVGVG